VKGGVTENNKHKYDDEYKHGTAVAMRLCESFAGSNRAIYADSYFASVECAEVFMTELQLYFTGVVKTSTARFPYKFLNDTPMLGQGHHKSMTMTTESGVELIAVVWLDRTRRTFISAKRHH